MQVKSASQPDANHPYLFRVRCYRNQMLTRGV